MSNVKACVGNDILTAKAKQILLDEKKVVQNLVADGTITEDQVPQWPSVGSSWVRDWRKRWRVSWKTKIHSVQSAATCPGTQVGGLLEKHHPSEVLPF